jgi:hypothetical protein
LVKQFLGEKDFLTSQDIPLLGKTLSEVLGIQQKLNDVLLEIKSNYPDTLQELSAQLLDKLGVSLKFSLDSDSLEASLYWNIPLFPRKYNWNMNFENSIFVFGGRGGLSGCFGDLAGSHQHGIYLGSLVAKVCGAYLRMRMGFQVRCLWCLRVSLTAKPLSGDLGWDMTA